MLGKQNITSLNDPKGNHCQESKARPRELRVSQIGSARSEYPTILPSFQALGGLRNQNPLLYASLSLSGSRGNLRLEVVAPVPAFSVKYCST
jgi:hypothetical protein